MEAKTDPAPWKTLLAFAIIYFVRGATYLAVRARSQRSPSPRQCISAFLLAILIFVLDYGLLFWAEQRITSGIAAVMMDLPGAPIDTAAAVALIAGSICWSLSSVLSRKLPLPRSKAMISGVQMIAGGILLALTAGALGEFRNFHPATVSSGAWLALIYLIVPGSIIAFTAYVWLIHHESPTKVGIYAYVNPVVAVLVGCFLGAEITTGGARRQPAKILSWSKSAN
jgi:drug/metabolite transporter (DMT)-like permease